MWAVGLSMWAGATLVWVEVLELQTAFGSCTGWWSVRGGGGRSYWAWAFREMGLWEDQVVVNSDYLKVPRCS